MRWPKAQHVLLLLIGALGVMLPVSVQAQVYTNDFSSLDLFNTMTVIDVNYDYHTWSYNSNGYAQYSYSAINAANDWLITPGITLEEGKTYQFDIDAWKPSIYHIERLEVKMGAAPTVAGMTTDVIAPTDITWDSIQTLSNNSVTVTTTGVYYFGIHAISDKGKWNLLVDNLVITEIIPEPYAEPTNLAVSNVGPNEATLTWTPGDSEQDAWQVVYGTGNFDPNTTTPINVTGNPTYTITGLDENTTYAAYVRSICDSSVSLWSDPVTFTTLDFVNVGDVTGDGNVDVSDVNAVINIILGSKTQADYPGNANVVGNDDTIDVSDVNAIINIILGKE